MKYLLIGGYPGVAVPLKALEACGEIRFVQKEYKEKIGWVFTEAKPRSNWGEREAVLLDDSEIQPYKETGE